MESSVQSPKRLISFWDVKWFDDKHKYRVYMIGATSDQPIVPEAKGKLRVKDITSTGYIDVQCYYSPHFTATLLSDFGVLRSQLIYESDKQFQKNYDKLSLQTLYELQQ